MCIYLYLIFNLIIFNFSKSRLVQRLLSLLFVLGQHCPCSSFIKTIHIKHIKRNLRTSLLRHLGGLQTRKNTISLHNLNFIYFSYTSLFLALTKEIAGKWRNLHILKKFTQTRFAVVCLFRGLHPPLWYIWGWT